MHISRALFAGLFLSAGCGLGTSATATEHPKGAGYRIRVEAKGIGQAQFSGLLTVNGIKRVLPVQRTPWEFLCEGGEVVSGRFRSQDSERAIKVRVFTTDYSMRRPSASAWGADIEFAWARPGEGPRRVDSHRPGSGVAALERTDALTLVRAFLFQEFVTNEGEEYTAAVFADSKRNALAAVGRAGHPHAETVRAVIAHDRDAHANEYSVRAHMAQARTAHAGDRSHEAWQKNLWGVFLDDPRYTARILTGIGKWVPIEGTIEAAPPLRTTLVDVSRIAPALATSLGDRASESGCDSNPLTALPAIASEDPLLVTTVFAWFTTHAPAERTTANAVAALESAGWTVGE